MSNSKRIAKNTLLLYFRMMLTMIVSLYTSRVILNVLGIQDYGIYTIVGGIVTMFGFFNAAMSSATQRYIAIEIGKGTHGNISKSFNSSLIIHIGIAIVVLIFAETIGLWFVNNRLNLPSDRIYEANFVYQFSIIASLISITQVPFNSLILAKEKMNIFALISIFEVILKLFIVYLLYISPFDKLKTYSVLILIVTLLISSVYKVYCVRNFPDSRFKIFKDKVFFVELLSYSGWNLFGNIAAVSKQQGINIILNLFFGTALNATFGIMIQIQNAVGSFVSNFQTAVNPQIYKYYSEGNYHNMQTLVFQSSRYSFFLLLIIISPIIYNIDFILDWWLKQPPAYSEIFVSLILINLLIESISYPLITAAMATGKIRNYQIVVGSLLFLNLPMSYIAFDIYNNPILFLFIAIFLSVLSLFFRVFFLKSMLGFKIHSFFKNVLLPIILLFLINLGFFAILNNFIGLPTEFLCVLIISFSIMFFNGLIILLFGINKLERYKLKNYIVNRSNR